MFWLSRVTYRNLWKFYAFSVQIWKENQYLNVAQTVYLTSKPISQKQKLTSEGWRICNDGCTNSVGKMQYESDGELWAFMA